MMDIFFPQGCGTEPGVDAYYIAQYSMCNDPYGHILYSIPSLWNAGPLFIQMH